MTPAEVLSVARSGAATGCREALFTLGDKPEDRYRVARAEVGIQRASLLPTLDATAGVRGAGTLDELRAQTRLTAASLEDVFLALT